MGALRKIQSQQIRIIWAIAKQLGISKDDVHAAAQSDSLNDLSYIEAENVIYRLRQLQDKSTSPRSSKAKHTTTPKGATADQQRKVWALMYQLKDLDLKPSSLSVGERLCKVIQKELHISCIPKSPFAWIGYGDCNKLIEKLKLYVASAERTRAKKVAADE